MLSFEFTRDFDSEIEAENASVQNARHAATRPVITPADLEAARAAAFAEGQAEGVKRGISEAEARLSAGFEAQMSETLAALLPELTALRAARAAHHDGLERDLLRLINALAQRILPEIFTAYAPARIAAFCRDALRMAEGPGGLELRLPAALCPQIEAALGAALTAEGAPVRLIADPLLGPGMAQASWDQGRASHAEAGLHQALLATLAGLSQFPQSTPALPTGADT